MKPTKSNNILVMILAVGVFGVLNTEMGVVGIVPAVADAYGVSVAEASLLVSGFALVVAIAAPVMPLLFSKVNRKTVMLLTLGIFTVCNGAAAFSPNFETMLALRIIPAAFHPLYTSLALAMASQMGTPAQAAKASSRVFVGVSAGMVLGAPVASALASALSLFASMMFFALVTLVVFVATVFLVPSLPVEHPLTYGQQLSILRKPLLWSSFVSVVVLNGAMFGFYGFLADYLESGLELAAAATSAMLLGYGAANIAGNLAAGRLLAKVPVRTTVFIPVALLVAFAGLFLAGSMQIAACVALGIIGILAGIANNVNQWLVSTAAPEAPDFANGLYLTAANLGVTLFTPFLGIFISNGGSLATDLGVMALLVAAFALIYIRRAVAHATTSPAWKGKGSALQGTTSNMSYKASHHCHQ